MAATKWGLANKIDNAKQWKSKTTVSVVPKSFELTAVMFEDSFWQATIDDYMKEVLVPEMLRVWEEEIRDPLATPHILATTYSSDAGNERRRNEVTGWGRDVGESAGEAFKGKARDAPARLVREESKSTMEVGFRDLINRLTKAEPISNAVGTRLGPMGDVLSLKLSKYSPIGGNSIRSQTNYNTFYYAVEYGTGMMAGWDDGSAGNPSWIRTEGPTKDPRPRYRGSWWLGRPGSGIHVAGQQGLHFLTDARTRDPNERWITFMNETIPAFLQRRVGMTTKASQGRFSVRNPAAPPR